MIKAFVQAWENNKDKVESLFRAKHPDGYLDIVKAVVSTLGGEDSYGCPDPKRIHEINDGDYQGTLLFVIAAKGYQPSTYWYVKVSYGSCSGCDTLEAIRRYDGKSIPTKTQVEDYMVLALHIVQGLKEMTDTEREENQE
jgi:hypothetical protein